MDDFSPAYYIEKHFSQFEPALKEKIISHCTVKNFSAGEILMQTGQYFRSTVLIVEGRVKLYREGTGSEEFFMYYLEPGSACALSIICATRQQTSEVMAKAIEPTTVLMIPIQLMDELMRDYKSWYYFVLDSYRTRFEELLTVVDNIIFKGMDERLEFYLKGQYEKMKTNQLRITHQEIANDLSTSREVVSRLLKKMEQNKKIKLFRNYIEWL
ncbi:CRP/FNR family transcriptional regulator [Arcticibacter tournemirensis]|uniref:Crp/Fnr family transcriptional regulator n=1 Tax=Arcticibacter tournemirensis TaxID=699437 RepID=A0A5M9HBB5_9SPHI|nr:Crp/Fnr family transcriptional regulator [Arcticibacter tournemirensis]KAA8482548.1 Crp/Fnr family transcriptional regulator [Arcticibacter tournemirensis]TQM52515.1 CRP/FNR family transcriptional regulator [Arcticibacter tournemirensis]